ncbi:MAG: hypothetical protein OXI11_12820 [Gammaproteobacteria bacterium]|nr:hypothetical protein [Gammaproteobacteria bacterium]MYD02077.1 hypothetical protein [Gammaproteobacteria bacterium]MYI25428.1 hypothetical protein [Gammaproteobacteria bacterium]
MPQPALDTHAEVRKLKQAGCPEEQAAAMVDLVSRAPVNAQIANSLNRLEAKVDSIEANMARMATKADLELLRAETKVDRAEAKADIEALRASMTRMLWIQGLALATLIISLAGIMLGLGAMPA